MGQQTLAQRARRPWLARVARRRTCAEGTTRPPAKPGLLLASVSIDASALFFFAFALFLFFCWRIGGIAAGAAGTRLGCHLALLQWWFTFYTPEARRNTGKQNASARARQRRLLFLGPRQDEAAKYLSVNFTRRPVPRGSFRGLLARRTTRPTRGLIFFYHIRRSSATAKLTLVPEVAGRELARELARDARFSAAASSSASSFFVLRQQLGHSAGVPLRPPARCASHCLSSSTFV